MMLKTISAGKAEYGDKVYERFGSHGEVLALKGKVEETERTPCRSQVVITLNTGFKCSERLELRAKAPLLVMRPV